MTLFQNIQGASLQWTWLLDLNVSVTQTHGTIKKVSHNYIQLLKPKIPYNANLLPGTENSLTRCTWLIFCSCGWIVKCLVQKSTTFPRKQTIFSIFGMSQKHSTGSNKHFFWYSPLKECYANNLLVSHLLQPTFN